MALVNHQKQVNYINLSLYSTDNTSVIGNKVYKSVSGLRRHMVVHKKEM